MPWWFHRQGFDHFQDLAILARAVKHSERSPQARVRGLAVRAGRAWTTMAE
jgi:hypothetical protein